MTSSTTDHHVTCRKSGLSTALTWKTFSLTPIHYCMLFLLMWPSMNQTVDTSQSITWLHLNRIMHTLSTYCKDQRLFQVTK